MWATSYISYNGNTQDASTTISASNVSSGSAGRISWTGTSCSYGSNRVNIAANGSITFTASSGYNITKIIIVSGSSADYYGTWTSSPSVTPTSSSGTTTFDGLEANSVTVTTSTAFRCTNASSIKIYYAAASATALAVKTVPTKINYKKGETLDLTGLVLNATVGGNDVDVTSGYTASPANGATLNSVGAQTVTFTYGGQNASQTIHVGDLESIALTTTGVKTTYDEGQTFDHTNLVVTATYSDGESTPTTWTEDVDLGDCSFDPDGALATTDDNVEVSYTLGSTTKTADIAITVNAASAYTVTFNAGTGSCATSSLTEASAKAGVTLPTATIGVTGWSFVGWATASTTNTEDEPTLYAAGSNYKPTEDCTLYAVYKYSEVIAYKRATSVSEITSASSVVIVCNNQSKVLDNTLAGGVTAPTETSSKINATESIIFTLTGDNTAGYTLTNSATTVGVTSTDNSTLISNTTTNDLWVVKAHNTSNTFYFENKGKSNLCLEYYNSNGYKWMVYAPNTPSTNAAVAMKVYVPLSTTVYNSNPAAIVNPTVVWTTDGDKTLYLQNTNTYDNAANVTGIAKTATYTSSDATVATVSEAGVVTALKKGTATITAKVAKEVGVNTEASVTYDVTVKDASNVAGIKAITSGSSVVTFTADLTDAVVTYVNGNHAYIQDASGAIYASCGSSLTAGKKINGSMSGNVKAANQIDEITAIDLSDATLTDGVIPSAAVITAATLVANKADYEGKLVSIAGAKVTSSLEGTSGGKISDDSKVTEINLYAPNSNIEALKDAEGTFNGYITLYGGSTVRFNIYEQSQITLTKNAPTVQPLVFAVDDVELDEATAAYTAFAGQAVTGAVGTVTYSIDSDDDGVVTSINASTGAVVLSGNFGTATIKATAAAKDVTEAGVTTPYIATDKTYTVTVYPRYSVTFHVNGITTVLREATHGAGVTVPTPNDLGDYAFRGWRTSTLSPTDDEPTDYVDLGTTFIPSDNDDEYYAVYAFATATPLVEHTSTFTIKQASEPESPYLDDGSSWTWSNVSFLDDNSGCIAKNGGTVTFTLPSGGKAVSLTITKSGNSWASDAAVVLKDASSNTLKTFTGSSLSYTFTSTYDHSTSYTLTNSTSKNAWIDHIKFEYTTGGILYSDYRTSLPTVELSIGTSGMLAFCYDRALDFSTTDVKAYKAKVEGGVVKLTKVSDGIVPANTGVILAADQNDYEIPVATADATTDFSDNEMVGVTQRTQVLWNPSTDVYNYILQSGEFKKASNGYLKPNRAYLSTSYNVSATSAREYLEISFEDDDVTGIDATLVNSEKVNSDIYDLQGRKVAQPTKGLYIVNGRKVIVK